MADWRDGRLGDVIELKRGYDLPERERDAGRFPIVSSGGVSGTHSQFKVRGPGVVTGRYGTLGQVFFVPSDFWPLNTTLYVRDFKGNDPRFISYFLRTINFLAYSDKAAVPGLNRNHLHEAKIRWPALRTQVAIAQVLAALDSKIDLNREVNKTLEAMAAAVFRSWFVDFDPVRAKIKSRPQVGIDASTAALFPDVFEDSPLGPVPRGWSAVSLGSMMQLKRGYDLPTSERRVGTVPIVSSSGISGWHDEAKVRGPSIVTGRYGTIGQVFLVWEDCWPLNTSLYVRDFKSTDPFFALYMLRNLDFLKFSDKGAVPGINRNHVETELVCGPPPELQRHFRKHIESWLSLVRENDAQSETLATLRDSLLPRLLSGELSISGAERSVGAVA